MKNKYIDKTMKKSNCTKAVKHLLYVVCISLTIVACNKTENKQETNIPHEKKTFVEVKGSVREMDKPALNTQIYIMPIDDTVINTEIIEDAIAVAYSQYQVDMITRQSELYESTNYKFWIENYNKAIKEFENKYQIPANQIIKNATTLVDTVINNSQTISFTVDSSGKFSQLLKTGQYLLLAIGNKECYPESCDFVFRRQVILRHVNVEQYPLDIPFELTTIYVSREDGEVKRMIKTW
ncbi:MAG: hypothetical protein IJ213_00835 [Bacteroidales bacterium]|nr:hypothetical protein [Bacteroidales bacterium]